MFATIEEVTSKLQIGRKAGCFMEQMTLFDADRYENRNGGTAPHPLASRLRPQTLEAFIGQEHLLGEGRILRQLIEKDQISSMIFWARQRWPGSLPAGRKRILSISVQ